MKLFVGGSRSVHALPPAVLEVLRVSVSSDNAFLVGDAPGADTAFQTFFAKEGLSNVTVFCIEDGPRNNVGNWPLRFVSSSARAGTYELYASKDAAMAAEADSGLILWDGSSKGTLLQGVRLVHMRKPVTVHNLQVASTVQLETLGDCFALIDKLPAEARRVVLRRLRAEEIGKTRNLFETAK